MRKMALLCMFVIMASASPIYATTPNTTNNSVNITNSTPLMNNTTTFNPVCFNNTNTPWNNTNNPGNTINTSVNSNNSTKHAEIQNLIAKIIINQVDLRGFTEEYKTLENQIPRLLKNGKYVQLEDLMATIKKDQDKITDLEKQDIYPESLINKLQRK